MRKISNLALTLIFTAACGAASAHAATTVTVSFDGFCDGMTLTTGDGLVGGTLAGCASGFVLGNKSIDYGLIPLDGTTGVVSNVQSTEDGSSEILTYYLDFENNTWANYIGTGDIPQLLNSGTFTVSAANVPINKSGPRSGVKQGNAVMPALPFSHTVTLAFTGYCNGLVLNFAGDLIGGTMTGCGTGVVGGNTGTDFGVPPFAPTGSGVAANVGSNENGEGNLLLFILDFANKTVSAYLTTNGVPEVPINATFTISAGNNPVVGSGPAFGLR